MNLDCNRFNKFFFVGDKISTKSANRCTDKYGSAAK